MIVRIWHGWTTADNADDYEQLLREEILSGIATNGIAGYRGAELLRRKAGEEVEFTTLLRFDSLESVRQLAGDDYETAYVPDKARAVLKRFDARAQHYEICKLDND